MEEKDRTTESLHLIKIKRGKSKQRGSALVRAVALILVIFIIGIGLLIWKERVFKAHFLSKYSLPTKITEEDLQILYKGENPRFIKKLSESESARRKTLENIKQTLAFAQQAIKEGLLDEEAKETFEEIKLVVTAQSYDMEKNKDKGPMPPFGFIEEEEVKKFYDNPLNQRLFDEFLNKALERARKQGIIAKDAEPSEEEIERAKSDFAKVRIYAEEFEDRKAELSEDFKRRVELRVKLQQASYLARRYSIDVLPKKLAVTDTEIEEYLKENPELDKRAEKRKIAEEVLARVQAGEDCAELARQFSEDPGSKDKGGLYQNIRKGSFIPEFEEVALSLQPGQIAPRVVESKYGYHIIKLERLDYIANRDGSETQIYDVRHILLSTNIKSPDNPLVDNVPLKDFVKEKLSIEKQRKVLEEIMTNNSIEIPEDFAVPELSPEQLKQLDEEDRIREEELRKLREEQVRTSGKGNKTEKGQKGVK